MKSKVERIKWKAELKNWLCTAGKHYEDKRGFLHFHKRTKKELADKMHISQMTVHRWFKTGNISPLFKRELLRLKIVRKEHL